MRQKPNKFQAPAGEFGLSSWTVQRYMGTPPLEHKSARVARPTLIHTSWLKPHGHYVSSLRWRGNELQLILRLSVWLPDQTERRLSVLVDTGAEANLIRSGLVPEHLHEVSTDPLSLRMATGQELQGGRRVVETNLGFKPANQSASICPSCRFQPLASLGSEGGGGKTPRPELQRRPEPSLSPSR